MKRLFIILITCMFSGYAWTEPELKGTPSELAGFLNGIPPTIEILGNSTINANADNAIVTLVVKTENEFLSGAIEANQIKREKVEKFLEANSFDPKNITSSKFSSTPEYGFFSEKPNNYKVNNAVLVTINSEKELFHISEAVDKFSDVFFVGTRFEHTEFEKYKSLALRKAIDNALAKRELYEKTLGAKLYVSEITENTDGSPVQTEFVKPRKTLSSYGGLADTSFGALVYKSSVSIKFKVQ